MAAQARKKLVGVYNIGSQNRPEGVINPLPKDKPSGAVRFVCISDTHSLHPQMKLPPGDVLIHGGDFSNTGEDYNLKSFKGWMEAQPHPYKVYIAGNHDVTMDLPYYDENYKRYHARKYNAAELKKLLTSSKKLIYLEDSETTVLGIKIYGSPWQPEFCNWAFNVTRGPDIKKYWDKIPNGVDVLLTHGPPKGHGGMCTSGLEAGCSDLLDAVKRVKPVVHVFGHIHEGYGVTTDSHTTYINASNCTYNYRPTNLPIVFDLIAN